MEEISRIFVDTNILIYAYSETEPKKKEMVLSLLGHEMVCLSTQVISEFIWVMNGKFNIDMKSLKVITDNLFEIYTVFRINNSTIVKAIDTALQFHFSYWDSLIVASAIESNCRVLYTEDLQHGQIINSNLSVLNPFK
ncbi:MAG: PIN domain-containing protein [Nitrospirae bacterium]|nr:PIN domain-containing protein [Nitrospirota bacterium]